MKPYDPKKTIEQYIAIWRSMLDDYETDKMPTVRVLYADVLNRTLFYPANKVAYGFAILCRRKTFTPFEVNQMREMGFKVIVETRNIQIPMAMR